MKKKRIVKNLLDMVPEQRYPSSTQDNGTVDVIIPRYGENFVGRMLSSVLKGTPVRVHLDRVGTRTWELCDGRRSVHEIGQHLHREFGDEIEPLYERLGLFFKQMENQRLIQWKSENPKPRS